MRLREIIREDYTQSLKSDLTNILINIKSMGRTEVETNDLVRQLRSMGYSSVDMNSIQPLLQNNPVVISSDNNSVSLKTESNLDNSETEKTAKRASEK